MKGGLEFEGASRSFGGLQALASFDLSCPPGSSTCIIGPNGAGKSTALGLASGLLRPSAGRVTLNDVPLADRAGEGAVGFMPQRSIFPASLHPREILKFSQRACAAPAAVCEAAMRLGGLDAVLDKPVRELSGGWLRRLGIACALLTQGPVLLLDEPFVGLDPETLDRLIDHLRRRSRDGGIVVTTSHDFEEIDSLGPQLVVLDEGRLLAVRPPGSEKARTLYRRMLTRPRFGDADGGEG